MKKEDLQKAMNRLSESHSALQNELNDLTNENSSLREQITNLKKKLEEAKKAAETAQPANADGQDGRAETEGTANSQKDDLKGKIGILLDAICQSCADHCPHHQDEDACRNCNIYKSVFNAGYKINRPTTEVIE